MIRQAILGGALLSLAACSGTTPTNTVDLAQVAATARTLCVQGKPWLDLALQFAPRSDGLDQVAADLRIVCAPLIAGEVPTDLNAGIPAWISQNFAKLAALLAH